jgi:uncharacterized RDD family membrane protein YckC
MAYSMPPHDPTNVMGRRIVAYIIDALISAAVFVTVLALTKDHSYVHAPNDACTTLHNAGFNGTCVQFGSRVYTWQGGGLAAGYLVAIGVSFANLVLLQGTVGASVGKMILGLRVVDVQGQICGVGRAFVRWVLLIVDAVFCVLIGLITAFATHPHRRVGDFAAGTYVIGVADAGRPIVTPGSAYQYGYAQPDPGGWAPPGGAPPGWGPPPPPPPAWGPPPEQQAWGAPPAAPGWGAPPPPPGAAPPPWGAPPPPAESPMSPEPDAPPATPPNQPGWGQPAAPTPSSEPTPPPPQPEPPPPGPPPDVPPPAAAPAPPAPPNRGESSPDKRAAGDDEENRQ